MSGDMNMFGMFYFMMKYVFYSFYLSYFYLSNLSGEIIIEYQQRQEEEKSVDELIDLVNQVYTFNMLFY